MNMHYPEQTDTLCKSGLIHMKGHMISTNYIILDYHQQMLVIHHSTRLLFYLMILSKKNLDKKEN